MKISNFFLPTLKQIPSDAQIPSHKLMLRSGMIRQEGAGIYTWLPLGLRVLKKIENIIREEHDQAGINEILMPTIQSADIWKESGRYEDYGKEMLRIKDRNKREMLYGPTNEEMITAILRSYIKSYKELPISLYHIQWKFRDEIRPRFGVMRCREFLMKDAYSFDLNHEAAKVSYQKMFSLYLEVFRRLGLKTIPVEADSGAIGGDLSHEFHILSDVGESVIYYDSDFDMIDPSDKSNFSKLSKIYAADEGKHDPKKCSIPKEKLKKAKGIEVGHIFYFGKKYSEPMKLSVSNEKGNSVTLEMGSYGIGVSRLPAAIIEVNHDDAGIIWPDSVAPFQVGLINLDPSDKKTNEASDSFYTKLRENNIDVLYDNSEERPGVKFANMDLIGLPWQLTVGKKALSNNNIDLKRRSDGKRQEMSLDSALDLISK